MSRALDVVAAVSGARRAVQLYPPAHPSFVQAIGATVAAVSACAASEGGFVLNVHEGRLYDGSSVLASDAPALSALASSLERHRIESLTFDVSFGETDAIALAEVLNMRPSSDLSVADELAQRGSTAIMVGVLEDEDHTSKEERDRKREQDRAMYRQLLSTLRTVNEQVNRGASPNLGQASSMVENIMARLVEDDSAVLGMALMHAPDESALFHSVNVMIYTLTIGLTLGLPDEGLLSLGMAALLHDVGKSAFDMKDPNQSLVAQMMHPQTGAEILSRLPDEDRAPMLVAYEHHMGANQTGYPERPEDYFTHPYSRIVGIADWYENLTKQSAERDPLTPDRAVMALLSETRQNLDPFLVRLFVKALGVFPIGCVVRLSDSSVGVVNASSDDVLSPRVRILFDDRGLELEDPIDLDLSQDERTIVEVLDPEALELAVADKV